MRRVAPLAVLLALAGCGGGINVETGGESGMLQCEQSAESLSGSLILMAQSVRTASRLPCIEQSPGGWALVEFDARSGRTRMKFAYLGRDDNTLTVEMTKGCDRRGSIETISDERGVGRYDRLDRAGSDVRDRRYYTYDGACTVYRFDLHGDGSAARADEITHALGFVSRDRIRTLVREQTDGRLQLDPDGAS